MKCPTCGVNPAIIDKTYGITACESCISKRNNYSNNLKKGHALTDYEKQKLSWYRNEKKWIENIQDRHVETDRQGNKVVVSQGKVLPVQPRQYWPKPKGA